jgi:hypothetical protein
VERRKYTRYSCILRATYANGETHAFLPIQLARIANISQGGVALHAGEQFTEGSRLTITLQSGGNEVGPVEVRIVRTVEQPNGSWLMGAEFAQPLSKEVLDFVLSEQEREAGKPAGKSTV